MRASGKSVAASPLFGACLFRETALKAKSLRLILCAYRNALRGLETVMGCKQAVQLCVRARVALIWAVMLLLLGSVAVATQPQSAYAATQDIATVNVVGTYHQTEARKGLALLNELRTGGDAWYWNADNATKTDLSGKLAALKWDYQLEKIAMQRAIEIAVQWDHARPDGSTCFTAYSGYPGTAKGENIAIGYDSISSVTTGWIEEDELYSGQGHRRNMLNGGFTHVAIACVEVNGIKCWAQEFGNTDSGTAATSAVDSKASVPVQIDTSKATFSLNATPASIELKTGESATLPSFAGNMTYSTSWPAKHAIPVESVTGLSWHNSDESVLAFTDDKIAAVGVGTATLTAYLDVDFKIKLGTVAVTVKDSSGADASGGDGGDKSDSGDAAGGDSGSSGDGSTGGGSAGDSSDAGNTDGSDTDHTGGTDVVVITKVICDGATYQINNDGTLTLQAAPKNAKSFTLPAKIAYNGKTAKVSGIAAKAFKNCKKLKTVIISSTKFTKASVKNALKGSAVKTIKVKVSSNAKTNKKYLAKYKKIFTKKICGKKVAVK